MKSAFTHWAHLEAARDGGFKISIFIYASRPYPTPRSRLSPELVKKASKASSL